MPSVGFEPASFGYLAGTLTVEFNLSVLNYSYVYENKAAFSKRLERTEIVVNELRY